MHKSNLRYRTPAKKQFIPPVQAVKIRTRMSLLSFSLKELLRVRINSVRKQT